MTQRSLHIRIACISALALFAELALIRYLGSEVRVFAYYKNLVLIACFLGFGLGFYRSSAPPRLGRSLAVLAAVVATVSLSSRVTTQYGPESATTALSNFAGSLTMGEQNLISAVDPLPLLAGFAWALVLFMASLASMYGFAQRIGADIADLPGSQRLRGYSINVAGSLFGILSFALVCHFAVGPALWFAPLLVGVAAFLPTSRDRWLALAGAPLLGLALIQPPQTVWSPYQRLDVVERVDAPIQVLVNGTGYMALHSFRDTKPGAIDRWNLPHVLAPNASSVLVIGAGGGNDVAAALHAGAKRVVAVEIDPEILAIGRARHPDRPYDDPRVHTIIDDARHYGETADERFDLIVFSHLDSHTALSGFTNVRLDNYIYTVESFRSFQRLLRPGGTLYVSFFATRRWVADRLGENLRRAFEAPPVPLYEPLVSLARGKGGDIARASQVLNAHFVASTNAESRARAERLQRAPFVQLQDAPPPPASTDDWPYLFSERREIPTPMLILALMLLTITGVCIGALISRELRAGGGWPIDRHFFFLGAGFLLVEVHNVGKLARAFGTTWLVNAWVIAAVMLVILLANVFVERWPRRVDRRLVYACLIAALIACAAVPIDSLLALPAAPVLVTLFYTLPLAFAGAIFATSFSAAPNPMRALGANLLGSLLGGMLELSSFVIGLSGLLYLAAFLYLASIPAPRPRRDLARSPKTVASPIAEPERV